MTLGKGKSNGGDSEGPSIEGAENRRKGGDSVDVYIGH